MTDVIATKESIREAIERLRNGAAVEEEAVVDMSALFNTPATPTTRGKVEFADIVGYPHSSGKKYYFTKFKCPDHLKKFIPPINTSFVFNEDYATALLMAIEYDEPAMAYGPPGTGKSETPAQICARLGRPYMFVSGMGGTEPADYIGQQTVENGNLKWVDGDVTRAVRDGIVLLFDEPFKCSSQTLMCLQSLMDGRRTLKLYGSTDAEDRTLRAHKDFRILMADNVRGTGDDMHRYGAEVQDQSTLNRHTFKVHVKYPNAEVEGMILGKKFPDATPLLISKSIQLANLIRTAWAKDDVSLPFSLRDSQSLVQNAMRLQSVSKAFSLCYYQAIADDNERAAVKKAWEMVKFGEDLTN
jgi:cobaltochelatase CobS